jgi:hypothetical protein
MAAMVKVGRGGRFLIALVPMGSAFGLACASAPRAAADATRAAAAPSEAAGAQPADSATRYAAHPMFIQVWAPEDAGLQPHAPFGLVEIACRSDETGPQLVAECTGAGDAPRPGDQFLLNPGYLARTRACFSITPRAPSPATLQAATEAWRKWIQAGAGPVTPAPFSALPDVSHAYLEIWLRQKRRVDVYRNTCGDSNAHRGPHDPICDPDMVPTGQTRVDEMLHADLVPPPEARDAKLFPPVPLSVFWIFIGTFTDHLVLDPTLVPSPILGVTDPAVAVRLLQPHRHEGSPERRAAILVDLAIAAFREKDEALGRDVTRQLEELVARGLLPAKALDGTLPSTLRSLEELAAGKWLLEDPCR